MKKHLTKRIPFIFGLIFSGLVFTSCSNVEEKEANTEEIEQPEITPELAEELQAYLVQHPVAIVISDKGCLSCNRKLVKLTRELMEDADLGVVLEASGRVFDISPLIKADVASKVFTDYKCQLSRQLESENSFILFSEGKSLEEPFEKIEITLENLGKFQAIVNAKIKLKEVN
jgi:hypothetical protein